MTRKGKERTRTRTRTNGKREMRRRGLRRRRMRDEMKWAAANKPENRWSFFPVLLYELHRLVLQN